MPEPIEPTDPPKPARPRRVKKFALPEHHHEERADERAAEHIDAFFEGPTSLPRRHRPTDQDRRLVELDAAPDWLAALQREAARHARYGRPASVLLIELDDIPDPAALDRTAKVVADVIRTHARETDRAVRSGTTSFRLLLPETGGRAARTVGERINRAFHRTPDGRAAGIDLAIDVASPGTYSSLEDALGEAERRLASRVAETPPGPAAVES